MIADRLRILMFSDWYGGLTCTFIRNEVAYLAPRHCLKYVALENVTPEAPFDVEVVPWSRRPLRDRIEWRLWTADLRCSFRNERFGRNLHAAIGRFRPDVIHCHFGYEALRLLQNVDVRGRGPVFVHFHGYDASEMLRKRSYIRALSPYLELPNVRPIVVSRYMRAAMANAGFNMSRAVLLRYGIDLDLFKPPDAAVARPTHDKVVIAQISSLIAKKGHRETLHAIARAVARNPALRGRILYRIAGTGPDDAAILDLAASLGLRQSVELLGPVTPAEAVALLADADVFAHHSITEHHGGKEGIPNAIMEAMAMELPILASRHAGIPELVEHGVHGLLCEEGDIDTYSRQIEEIIGWGRRPANRARIEREYNYIHHNHELEEAYRMALASGATLSSHASVN